MTTPNTDALPTDEEIRLHLGELSTRELRIAKAAIQWANIRTPAPSASVAVEEDVQSMNKGLKCTSSNGFEYQCKICGGNPTAFPYKPEIAFTQNGRIRTPIETTTHTRMTEEE